MDFIKTTEFLRDDMIRFLKVAPVVIPEDSSICGFSKFDPEKITPPTLPRDMELYDNLHFSMGTTFLTYGFKGVAEKALQNIKPDMPEENRVSLEAIAATYFAVCEFMEKHEEAALEMARKNDARKAVYLQMAMDLHQLAAGKPETLRQAVQAFYFVWKLRGILNTSTMGRIDQYFYPFYKADLEAGRTTREEAYQLIKDYWILANKSGSGDTLMNVMLGGQDIDGNDVSNELSIIMLEVTAEVCMPEPHVNYRYHKNIKPEFFEAACRLQLEGTAHATLYNDENLIPALERAGIPHKYAVDYTNDGCTETTIDQKSTIFFDRFDAVTCFWYAFFNGDVPALPGKPVTEYWTKYMPQEEWTTVLETGVKSGDMAEAKTFDECYEMFKAQFKYQMTRSVRNLCKNYHWIKKEDVAPPLLNGSYEETLATGNDTHRDGLPVRCLTMFSGSFGTVADCLAAVKETVFDEKLYTIEELRKACEADFVGYEEIQRRLLAASKFGNDIDEVDGFAAEIANLFCDICKEVGDENDLLVWPAFLGYMFVQETYMTGATPDGRKWKDPISEHYSPTPGRAVNGPTAVIRSAAKGPHGRCCGTSVLHLALSRPVVPKNEEGLNLLKVLNKTCSEAGLNLVNFGIYDINELLDARIHPERHEDIIVRVWGYSARFIDLSEEMQNHVMRRILSEG